MLFTGWILELLPKQRPYTMSPESDQPRYLKQAVGQPMQKTKSKKRATQEVKNERCNSLAHKTWR